MGKGRRLALALALGLVAVAAGAARAASIEWMEIIATERNEFMDIVWPWPATALRIITVSATSSGKVAEVTVWGDATGVEFTLDSCRIPDGKMGCMPAADTPKCCALSSRTLPTQVNLLPGAQPGKWSLYLSAPGSVLK